MASMTNPKRIRLRRTPGYRKPAGAIVVARPSKWGNPYRFSDVAESFPSLTAEQCVGFVANQFRHDLRAQHPEYPSDAEIRTELAGHDLACWCPLDAPWCHGDDLLKIANSGDADDRAWLLWWIDQQIEGQADDRKRARAIAENLASG